MSAQKKDKKPRVVASPAELEAKYRENVAKCVQRMTEWDGKLIHLLKSKKYNLTDADKEKIGNAVIAIQNSTIEAMQTPAEKGKETFTL